MTSFSCRYGHKADNFLCVTIGQQILTNAGMQIAKSKIHANIILRNHAVKMPFTSNLETPKFLSKFFNAKNKRLFQLAARIRVTKLSESNATGANSLLNNKISSCRPVIGPCCTFGETYLKNTRLL